jgi:hypothetical protein
MSRPIITNLVLKVDMDGMRAVEMLQRLEERLKNMRPFFLAAGRRMRRSFAENFAAGGRPAWEPQAESTKDWKRVMSDAPTAMAEVLSPADNWPSERVYANLMRKRTGRGTLPAGRGSADRGGPPGLGIVTGAMRNSIAQSGTPGNVSRIHDYDAEFGARGDTVNWFQRGTVPHHIEAVRASALQFWWHKPGGGFGWNYRQSVEHPGTKPRPVIMAQDEDIEGLR